MRITIKVNGKKKQIVMSRKKYLDYFLGNVLMDDLFKQELKTK